VNAYCTAGRSAFLAIACRGVRMGLCLLAVVVLLQFTKCADAQAGGVEPITVHELSKRRILYEGDEGASCANFLDGALAWQRRGGDWKDANGKLHGDLPFAEEAPGARATLWDVTALVRQWADAEAGSGAFFLRSVSGQGFAVFLSREAKSPEDWPMLVLELADGRRQLLKPMADTFLDCSTYRSLGRSENLKVFGSAAVVVQFQLPAKLSARSIKRAQLVLSNASAPGGGAMRIGVFEMAAPSFPAAPVLPGLAADYPADKGIESHPDVVFAAGFEEWLRWRWRWAKDSAGNFDIVSSDSERYFEPLFGRALRVNIKKGDNLGADLRLYLKDNGGEVDELFFRYYLRLGDDWDPTVEGGKLPGLAGTYGTAGWGGRRSDGSNGWSLRGSFGRAFAADSPLHGLNQLGTYAYYADMPGTYGDGWFWPGALLQRNRWYAIEQQVRLNTPGAADGLFRVWVDGRLVMERQQLRIRTVARLRIEMVWMNIFHGGVARSPYDQHLYIDNVVVARRYIGPLATPPGQASAAVGK